MEELHPLMKEALERRPEVTLTHRWKLIVTLKQDQINFIDSRQEIWKVYYI